MSKRMLIDARHPEETRVAVVEQNRIEEFDFESSEHKQLKGNIYLAKVTRVEPSLQAAFVEYGGNRHGFLAFSEIHPDYYQIPKSDRDALLAEEAEHAAEEQRLREEAGDFEPVDGHHDDDGSDDRPVEADDTPEGAEEVGTESDRSPVDESAVHEVRKKRQALRRRYKIQDVIQRRQVLLVQVVKEERGNKGAALTTYLSLAGRYCVLMPNTSHGGGISRKISNGNDRKRLKQIMSDLKLPGSMGLIVRTAGLSRTKTEIKRDFDYLARLWDEIRDKTLKSAAPALIYRDSDLVKRAIRDLYSREIDEVMVEGEEGYKAARGFMKLLMPSHVKRVQLYDDPTPIFQRFGIEDQLSGMYQPVVQLKSGGYLVINPTEALVSIDINSGRSTREHNIENTAFQTNLEAAKEIARQLRLRDMAGLVVIDFIDMEQNGHVRKVEKAMKDALKNDRARIQVGRISGFGLMEMSRQRLRTGMLEASTHACPHCEGTGLMRTASSSGLSALRMIEDEAARGKGNRIVLRAGREAAIFLLNKKRAELAEVEQRYGVSVEVIIDEGFEGAKMSVESHGPRPPRDARPKNQIDISDKKPRRKDRDEELDEEDEDDHDARDEYEDEDEDKKPRRRRRRRGGRGRRRRGGDREGGSEEQQRQDRSDDKPDADDATDDEQKADRPKRRSRARKADTVDADEVKAEDATDEAAEEKPKTRRRPRAKKDAETVTAEAKTDAKADEGEEKPTPKKRAPRKTKAKAEDVAAEADEKPAKKRAPRKTKAKAADDAEAGETTDEKPKRKPRATKAKAKSEAKPDDKPEEQPKAEQPKAEEANDGPPRTGWWQRTFG